MKLFRLFFIYFFFCLLCSADAAIVIPPIHAHINSIELRVINSLREESYIGVCTASINNQTRTICSDIQHLKMGPNRIFIPPYPNAYPVISSANEKAFTCGTPDNPTKPLFFSSESIKNNTLILDSYILDKDKNRLAVLCILQEDKQGLAQF